MEQPLVGGPRRQFRPHTLRPLGPYERIDAGRMDARKTISGVYSSSIDKFLQGYAQAGVPVNAITCQNEVARRKTEERRPVAGRLHRRPRLSATIWAPCLRAQHQQTQIWLLDHNYNLSGRVASQM